MAEMNEERVPNPQYITQEGYDEKKRELEYRENELRPEISNRIKVAREQGDLSENAEYDAAKEEQAENESIINELRTVIRNAVVIDNEDNDGKTVNIGCAVTLHNVATGDDVTFNIVGSSETNSLENKISNESPIGKAIMGKRTGAKVVIEVPAGNIEYKIKRVKVRA